MSSTVVYAIVRKSIDGSRKKNQRSPFSAKSSKSKTHKRTRDDSDMDSPCFDHIIRPKPLKVHETPVKQSCACTLF